jgi:two-component system sensor histidine kinase KdpD
VAADSVSIAFAVGVATAGVAALQSSAPAAGLGILYLLAVLAVAIRRGQVPALVAAVVSVLVLNYLFITPRHRLSIAHSQDVVELTVLLIAAVVVGRLAATGREKASEAESRAALAAAREREAKLIAQAAAAVLAGENVQVQLENIGKRIAAATGASRARVVMEPVPSPGAGELAVPLPSRARRAWLYVADDAEWPVADVERVAEPLGRLIDVAF